MSYQYKGKTLYHSTHVKNLKEIAENGLICDKSNSRQKSIYFADCPDVSSNYSCRDDEDWVMLEVNIDDLDLYMMNSDDYELRDYMRSTDDPDLDEYDNTFDVPWPLSLEKVSQVAYSDNIRPHLIKVSEYLTKNKDSNFPEGEILNKDYAKKAWMEKGNVKSLSHGYIQSFQISENGERIDFPKDIIELFTQMGSEQRNKPERAMLDAQKYMGGGVLSYAIEHVGDIYHRMTHHAKHGSLYPEIVFDKTSSNLERLKKSYGFSREHLENLKSNAKYSGVSFEEFKEKVDEKLLNYANEHRKLKTYNKPQWLAREAAISLGEQNFERAINCLSALENIVRDPVEFSRQASKVMRDKNGKFIEYDGLYQDHIFEPNS